MSRSTRLSGGESGVNGLLKEACQILGTMLKADTEIGAHKS
jgi:hypothetical protein